MTAFHILYIPAVFALGIFIGISIGEERLRRSLAERERRERERHARRDERRAERGPGRDDEASSDAGEVAESDPAARDVAGGSE